MFYRKKPVVIEALQWNGENQKEIMDFIGSHIIVRENGSHIEIIINTLEGDMIASVGDYIIKGVDGEFYPCKPDIFLRTYDLVEDNLSC